METGPGSEVTGVVDESDGSQRGKTNENREACEASDPLAHWHCC